MDRDDCQVMRYTAQIIQRLVNYARYDVNDLRYSQWVSET